MLMNTNLKDNYILESKEIQKKYEPSRLYAQNYILRVKVYTLEYILHEIHPEYIVTSVYSYKYILGVFRTL